jgi:predicted RNase H-like nuclease (RuvC/YqgF family)
MSSLDLYDDLFPEETYNRDENGEANVSEETGSSLLNTKDKNIKTQMKKVEEYNKKLESELNVLKKENKNWQLVYRDVERKLEMSKKNVTILLKTTRNEISRKNDTISCLKREIDNMLFKRAVKSGTVNELKEMIDKIHSAFQIEISGKNQTDITTKSDKNGEPKKPSNILNKPVLNDNKKPRDGKFHKNT